MSVARRRRHHLAWCRYVARTQVPVARWQHRAPRCDNPRPSGLVRAWEAVVLASRGRWPWQPAMIDAPGLLPGYETVHLPEEAV